MKERGILFNAPMVRATREGRKTQTRRVVKPQPDFLGSMVDAKTPFKSLESGLHVQIICPFGQPGDRLWVRETWKPSISHSCAMDACDCEDMWVEYPSGGDGRFFSGTQISDDWTFPRTFKKGNCIPSIHMPRWANRILLEVVSVRVERLNDISEADAGAEGCPWSDGAPDEHGIPTQLVVDAKDEFAHLWRNINGAGSWDTNPWVWVIDFELVKP
ncbi:MAG: hypothetical protein C0466_07770 [Candidatus Accumulibacter sp.]|nr:hypothetical protein [Accumulibacter sp.]